MSALDTQIFISHPYSLKEQTFRTKAQKAQNLLMHENVKNKKRNQTFRLC